MPANPLERARVPWTVIAIAIGIFGVLFIVGLKYAWSRLDMTVSTPTLVTKILPTGARIRQIQGSFRLEHDLNGILSRGIGGACLIGDFADRLTPADATTKGVVTTPCTNKKQCNPNLPDLPDPRQKPGPTNPQKWEGYCVPDVPVRFDAERGQGKCWYKPWDEPNDGLLCETSGLHLTATTPPTPTPWQVGIDYPTPKDDGFSVQDFYNRYTGGQPVKWRVSGRLFNTDARIPPKDVFGPAACIAPGGQPCL